MISTLLALAPLLGSLGTQVSHDAGGPGLVVVGLLVIVVIGVGVVALIGFAVWFLTRTRRKTPRT